GDVRSPRRAAPVMAGGAAGAVSTANGWLPAALLLVFVGGLLASAETALSRISRVRAAEYVREGRRGARRLQAIVADPPRYLNLLLLLRLSCELSATVIA